MAKSKCSCGCEPSDEVGGIKAVYISADSYVNDLSNIDFDNITKLNIDNTKKLPTPFIGEDGRKWYPKTFNINL